MGFSTITSTPDSRKKAPTSKWAAVGTTTLTASTLSFRSL